MDKDYKTVYCKECKKDIPFTELEDGSVIIHCPRCTGECLTCDCHLVSECFSDAPTVRVLHDDSNIIQNDL